MDTPKCELCGEPMPPGEEMFKFHGYTSPCPKPPLPKHFPRSPEQKAEKARVVLMKVLDKDEEGMPRILLALKNSDEKVHLKEGDEFITVFVKEDCPLQPK